MIGVIGPIDSGVIVNRVSGVITTPLYLEIRLDQVRRLSDNRCIHDI